ncbi:MAG: hypothetical protein ACKVK6_14350 [bacterium]
MSMMSAVDLTLVSVVLPYCAGDLGATPDWQQANIGLRLPEPFTITDPDILAG